MYEFVNEFMHIYNVKCLAAVIVLAGDCFWLKPVVIVLYNVVSME